nr:hypothetical protein [Tanacetum cinerariifolium]
DECPKNIGSNVAKNLKKLSQAPRGVSVGPKVDYPGDHDSEDEVKLVDSEMASFLALKRVDYGTNRLLEYWKKTYENAHYDYDPYGDDMYEGQEIHDIIQSMCDNLDIKVRGRKKK